MTLREKPYRFQARNVGRGREPGRLHDFTATVFFEDGSVSQLRQPMSFGDVDPEPPREFEVVVQGDSLCFAWSASIGATAYRVRTAGGETIGQSESLSLMVPRSTEAREFGVVAISATGESAPRRGGL